MIHIVENHLEPRSRRLLETMFADRKRLFVDLFGWEVPVVDGRYEIDNNLIENAIRPTCVGKKNWMFIADVGAGQRSATLYSLPGSCLRRGINPRACPHWLFDRLPAATNRTVHTLTPAAYAALTAGVDKAETSKAA